MDVGIICFIVVISSFVTVGLLAAGADAATAGKKRLSRILFRCAPFTMILAIGLGYWVHVAGRNPWKYTKTVEYPLYTATYWDGSKDQYFVDTDNNNTTFNVTDKFRKFYPDGSKYRRRYRETTYAGISYDGEGSCVEDVVTPAGPPIGSN